jgi:hypothetical protein
LPFQFATRSSTPAALFLVKKEKKGSRPLQLHGRRQHIEYRRQTFNAAMRCLWKNLEALRKGSGREATTYEQVILALPFFAIAESREKHKCCIAQRGLYASGTNKASDFVGDNVSNSLNWSPHGLGLAAPACFVAWYALLANIDGVA